MQNFKNPEIYNLYFSIQESFKSVKILGIGESEKTALLGKNQYNLSEGNWALNRI